MRRIRLIDTSNTTTLSLKNYKLKIGIETNRGATRPGADLSPDFRVELAV